MGITPRALWKIGGEDSDAGLMEEVNFCNLRHHPLIADLEMDIHINRDEWDIDRFSPTSVTPEIFPVNPFFMDVDKKNNSHFRYLP